MYLVSFFLLFVSTSLLAFNQPDIDQMTNIQRATIMPPSPLYYPPANPLYQTPAQPQMLPQPQYQTPMSQPLVQPQMQQERPFTGQPQPVPQPQMQQQPMPQTLPQQQMQQPPMPQSIPQQQMQQPPIPQGQLNQRMGNPGSLTVNPPLLTQFENQEAMAVVYNQKDKDLKWVPCRGHYPKGCEVSILHGDFGLPEADYYVRVPPKYEFPAHVQTSTVHMALVDGEFRMRYLGQKEFRLREGNFVFLPPDLPRNMKCVSKEACVMFVHFDKPSQSFLWNGKFE